MSEEDIPTIMYENDPATNNNAIQVLINELNAFKYKVNELTETVRLLQVENNDLKLMIFKENDSQNNDVPRKIARIGNMNSSVITKNKSWANCDNKSQASEMPDRIATDSNNASNGINNNTNYSRLNNNVSSNTGVKKKKTIQAIETNLQVVRNTIKATNCTDFSIRQTSAKAPVKISINSPSEVEVVRNALKSNNISYHEFKWAEEKSKCFIIRGLVGISEEMLPEIKEDLIKSGIPAEASLTLLITGHMRANPQLSHNTLLKLVVPPHFDVQMLNNIKFIDHISIKFEAMKAKSIIQCKNCQRFGHSAGGCQHKHRCVKCGQNHFRDDCPRSFNKATKLICCNCGGEHTANNLTVCSYFLNNFNKNKTADNNTNIKNNNNNNNGGLVNSNTSSYGLNNAKRSKVTYADVAGGISGSSNINNNNNNNNNISNQLGNDQNVNLNDLANKIDVIFKMVSRHETLLKRLGYNG